MCQTGKVEDHQVLCLRFDALAWSKALKYSWSSCRACSEIAFGLELLLFDDNELRDEDGVSDRSIPCEAGWCACVSLRMK